MTHPSNRAERRHQRSRVIAKRRFIELHVWADRVQRRTNPLSPGYDPTPTEWGRYAKWNMNCGCGLCQYDKYGKHRRKRREALKRSAREWERHATE